MKKSGMTVVLCCLLAGCLKTDQQTFINSVFCPVEGADTAVLLVGGSGDVDLDYTVNGIPLFQQLAEGLQQNGIASLRIEKKAKRYQTIEEEWIYRIEYGLDLLRQRFDHVYLLGHSLSAIILPVFDERADGLILMAGAVSEVEEVYASQLLKHADKKEAIRIQQELATIQQLEMDSGCFWFGVPESWWISLDQLNVSHRLKELHSPVLVLTAGQDDLTDTSETANYQMMLKHHPDAEFEVFEHLNHFFVDSDHLHLDESVIERIASWILKRSSCIINERGAVNEKSNFHC